MEIPIEFDAYLMIDWSASSRPVRGSDSIWYCLMVRGCGNPNVATLKNPPTRRKGMVEIRSLLRELAQQGKTVLVGFDFPFGYPTGFANALRLPGAHPWLEVWREIATHVIDRDNNSNNRFDVAAELNRRISGACYPFWGCPVNCESATMSSTKGSGTRFPEKRVTDMGGMQPIWKLYGKGSVGSQALLGIPHLAALRNDIELAAVSRVWPFETGLVRLPRRRDRGYLIVYAEIYPSLVPTKGAPGDVKDALQVKGIAGHFAALDETGELPRLFEGASWLTPEERVRAEREEGWTLGVLRRGAERAQPEPDESRVRETRRLERGDPGLPECDFVYFATPACASSTLTAEFVGSAKAIIAHAYNKLGQRMPLVQELRPGRKVLLVYGSGGKYTPMSSCQAHAPEEPVLMGTHRFEGFCYVPESLHEQLKSAGYQPDPVIKRFVAISVELVQDLRGTSCVIAKPKGNNTLRRGSEVFARQRRNACATDPFST